MKKQWGPYERIIVVNNFALRCPIKYVQAQIPGRLLYIGLVEKHHYTFHIMSVFGWKCGQVKETNRLLNKNFLMQPYFMQMNHFTPYLHGQHSESSASAAGCPCEALGHRIATGSVAFKQRSDLSTKSLQFSVSMDIKTKKTLTSVHICSVVLRIETDDWKLHPV